MFDNIREHYKPLTPALFIWSGQRWIGIFNRTDEKRQVKLAKDELSLKQNAAYEFENIWGEPRFSDEGVYLKAELEADGVLFLHYRAHV